MRQVIVVLILWTLPVFLWGCGANYQSVMERNFKTVLGSEFGDYTLISYPTNNFGVGTSFYLENENGKPTDGNRICATYSCLAVDPLKANSTDEKLSINGFADYGQGTSLTITETDSSELSAEFNLPEILQALDINVAAGATQDLTLSFEFGKGYKRSIKKQKFLDYLKSLQNGDLIRRARKTKKVDRRT